MTQHEFNILLKADSIKPVHILMKTGEIISGFFDRFDDYEELRSSYQYRFIPNKNIVEYCSKRNKNKKDSSIIIDTREIRSVQYS